MSASYHVNGGCQISVNTGSGLTAFGIAEDEIDIEIIPHYVEIPIDTFGGTSGPPGEIQAMPAEAIARIPAMVWYDAAVLQTLIKNSLGGMSAFGTNVAAGTLLGANSLLSRFVFPSPIDSLPFNFLYGYLLNPGSFRMSTKYQRIPMTVRAIPYTATPTSSASVATWNQTTS